MRRRQKKLLPSGVTWTGREAADRDWRRAAPCARRVRSTAPFDLGG